MARSSAVAMLMLSLLLLGSSWWPPVAAARPLLQGDGGEVVAPPAGGGVGVLVLPSSPSLRHWLPVLEMKQGASCQTNDPNNVNCPPKPPK
uniref:Uncharacterized protein n=1 Tax=Oryza meridionalis TaxID=40149 RepID=A0A0E0DZV5_9ORYZ